MQFHEILMQLRKTNGWSQDELGYKLGVTRQTVSKWEMGLTTPEMDKLIEMSRIFGVSIDELTGNTAPDPQRAQIVPPATKWGRTFFEYKSKAMLFGIPLLHIHWGIGPCRAKGIIALGNIATGIVAVGAVATGVLTLGAFSFGIAAIGALCAGVFAFGGGALGLWFAAGGIAVGYIAVGGVAAGFYSLGGFATGLHVAAGGMARAPIAIGGEAIGDIVFRNATKADFPAIREAILAQYPNVPPWILRFLP